MTNLTELLSNPIFYAVGASLFAGLYSFTAKIAGERKYEILVYIFYVYIFQFLLAIFFLLLNFENVIFNLNGFLIGIFMSLMNIGAFYSIQTGVKNISTSLFFINYRVLSSLLLLIVGLLLFSESLTVYNIFGFISGFLVLFLLYENEKKERTVKQLKLGIISIFTAIFFVVFGHTIFKDFIPNISVEYFYFVSTLTSSIIILLLNKLKQNNLKLVDKKFLKLSFFHAVFFFLSLAVFLFKAYETGYLSISYKILSYSIFIPIFLSIIIYKEKLTLKRIIAFILTIISILFFIY